MRARVLVLVLAIGALAHRPAFAGDAPPADGHSFENQLTFGGDDAAPEAKPTSAASAFGSFVGYTLVILLLLCGLLYFVKRFVPGARALAPSEAIQVLGRRSLTPQAQIFIVQIGKKLLRVGVTKEGMTSLGEISDPDEIALVRGQCAGKKDAAFEEELKRKSEPAPVEEVPASDVKKELESIRKTVEGWSHAA